MKKVETFLFKAYIFSFLSINKIENNKKSAKNNNTINYNKIYMIHIILHNKYQNKNSNFSVILVFK